MPIPIYMKTVADMPRPKDPEFYLFTQDGTFFCRNHAFFQSDVKTKRPIRALAKHEAVCHVNYPKLGVATLEYILGFFDKVFQRHSSESVVLLLWDLDRKRYRLHVPDQVAGVWESFSGIRSPLDVKYQLPKSLPLRHLLVGDIHCHGDIGAYASWTDQEDEVYRDGVHIIVGHIDREIPTFHSEVTVDGGRFPLPLDSIFKGWNRRRKLIPDEWMKKVKVKIDRPKYYSYGGKGYTSYYSDSKSGSGKKYWE